MNRKHNPSCITRWPYTRTCTCSEQFAVRVHDRPMLIEVRRSQWFEGGWAK